MSGEASGFQSRRLGGVRHAPEADIESIRDLLRGYGSARSILKELIQNAEDAGASRLDALYLHGDSTSPHTLLHGPGLLVANDGPFTVEHRDAITQLNLGTKGTEDRAIGRFGKGLKSVFAWSEAFYIIARTDPDLGWPKTLIVDFFNPWHDWRHKEWESEFNTSSDTLIAAAEQRLNAIYPEEKPWLAFWFPLRLQRGNGEGEEADEWIFPSFPGDDRAFCSNLKSEFLKLVPSLVCLRSIELISISDHSSDSTRPVTFQFRANSKRIPDPDAVGPATFVAGTVELDDTEIQTSYRYSGFAGHLQNEHAKQLKSAKDWPTIVQRTGGRNSASVPVKGAPHFAALATWCSAEDRAQGSLDIQWCVFFPVGKQPPGNLPIRLRTIRHHITINLHGFFFLDSDRLRIDGLEDGFSHSATDRLSCLEWNRLLASEGTLSWLPQALSAFADEAAFTNGHRREIAEVIGQTWLWETFRSEICQKKTWRPRWKSGEEVWECIPAEESVFAIPDTSNRPEFLTNVPMLARISEELVLVAGGDDDPVAGLYCDAPDVWPEDSALRLLQDVKLNPTRDEITARWLNSFLSQLHREGALTPAIRERASGLSLLSVRNARTNARTWISAQEWNGFAAVNQLFISEHQSENLLASLCGAFPEWSCFVFTDAELPLWFAGLRPPTLDASKAAQIGLSQSAQGNFIDRRKLFEHFASLPARITEVRLVMRFLMHASGTHSQDDRKQLFVPSTQQGQQIWAELIQQLLEQDPAEESWRLVDVAWSPMLSPQLQQELNLATFDAEGARSELIKTDVDFGTLNFRVKDWSTNDICELLRGLFQETRPDQALALLRRLPIHRVQGMTERVSIADATGELDRSFILDNPGFPSDLPRELEALWQNFRSETRIVEQLPATQLSASSIQRRLFLLVDAEGEYAAELNWNYVVRHCLNVAEPSERAALIMEALKHGHGSAAGVGGSLKDTKWLPLVLGGKIAPSSLVHIEGLEKDLHHLFDPEKDGLAGIRSLPERIVTHPGFSTLRNYLPRLEEALRLLGLWLEEKPEWHLGLTKRFEFTELDLLLSQLQSIENLPIAGFLAKLRRVRGRLDSEIDPLLREWVLPVIQKRFDYTQSGVERIKGILLRLQASPTRFGFDAYLAQACDDFIIESILPSLSLVNQQDDWVPAAKLIWPSTNLDPSAQLCAPQARILSRLNRGVDQTTEIAGNEQTLEGGRAIQATRLPDFVAEIAKLREYVQPFRDSNVGDTLPAALVAVLGGHPATLEFLQELLQSGLKQQPDDFLAMLLEEQGEGLASDIRSVSFAIEIARGDSTEATSITNNIVNVALTTQINTLVVGDPGDLWRTYYNRDARWHRVRLRWVGNPDELSDWVAVFSSTIETILLRSHCNGLAGLCPKNIKERLSKVADAGQADLRRSQIYLLEIAEARLKELGVKGQPQFDSILRKFEQARQTGVDAELLESGNPTLAKKRQEQAREITASAKRELVHLLDSDPNGETRKTLVEAVRRKMTDFQYNLASIPLELFQNADDAVAELNAMQGAISLEAERFVLRLDVEKKIFEIVHWGRPINQHQYPGFYDGYNRGYDQDLQKMLTLNFSDKGIGTDNPAIVTGRFGLGFKSAFFIAGQPEIVSGRLALKVRGAFYPVPLPPDEAKDLRDTAGKSGTAIRLKWKDEAKTDEISAAVDAFARVSALLTVFSRGIRTIAISRNGDTVAWANVGKTLTRSGSILVVQIGSTSYLTFQCTLHSDHKPATILFQLDANGISHLPEDLTGLWITTPTAERSELPWAVNAPFKPDAGRQQLARNNPQNHDIAEAIAQAWGEALVELFDEVSEKWTEFASKVGLHAMASEEKWWSQLWGNTTRRSPVLRWDEIQHGGEVLNWIAWNESCGSMRWLVQHRSAVPSQLPVPYRRLVKVSDIKSCISGLLADIDNGCFGKVSEWASMLQAFPPGHTVHAVVKVLLDEARCASSVEIVTLASVLTVEVGTQNSVNPETADRIGSLFKDCDSAFDGTAGHIQELQALSRWSTGITMLAQDGEYRVASELICGHASALIDKDERLRAAFAPKPSVLSPEYSSTALILFVKARGKLTATADTLAAWVRGASLARLASVFDYLMIGELGQQLADKLARPWLESKKQTDAWRRLSQAEKNEIERKFLKGSSIDFSTIIQLFQPSPPVDIEDRMEPKEAFRLISKWWTIEGTAFVSEYEGKTYPAGFTGKLPWPGEDAWDEGGRLSGKTQWLMVFIHAALVPLGFNKIGRDQRFSEFLISDSWLDVLANVSEDPDAVLGALDRYLDRYIQDTEHHFQMRQFIAFYAIARNLEPLLLSIKEAERSLGPAAFNLALAPKANPMLTGTGIEAPPLTGMLGIGSCHLFRELYRLRRLSNPSGYRLAFTPIRKVRRLCDQILGIREGNPSSESAELIFQGLSDLAVSLGLDPTFNHCFDLPLQFLAEDGDLRARVLNVTFEMDSLEDDNLDGAPPAELM